MSKCCCHNPIVNNRAQQRLIHDSKVINNTNKFAMVCNEKGMYLVVAEHLLNSGEFRFGRNCLWGASHGLADRQIDEILQMDLEQLMRQNMLQKI